MSTSYTTTLSVDRSPADVCRSVSDVRGWWMADIDGSTVNVGDEFSYEVRGMHYRKMRVTELDPGKKVPRARVRRSSTSAPSTPVTPKPQSVDTTESSP